MGASKWYETDFLHTVRSVGIVSCVVMLKEFPPVVPASSKEEFILPLGNVSVVLIRSEPKVHCQDRTQLSRRECIFTCPYFSFKYRARPKICHLVQSKNFLFQNGNKFILLWFCHWVWTNYVGSTSDRSLRLDYLCYKRLRSFLSHPSISCRHNIC